MDVTRQNWFKVKGDETLALDWPLNSDSHVWEIGGFEGRWAAQMYDKFHCNIMIFEPQLWAVDRMLHRFRGNPKIKIRPYGLWVKDSELKMGDFFTDGASLYKVNQDKPEQTVKVKNHYFEIYNFNNTIDLALMNVEGAEYVLIPDLVASGIIVRFERFWCQFHPSLVFDGEKKSDGIFERMAKTHKLLWDCYPTAVAWEKR